MTSDNQAPAGRDLSEHDVFVSHASEDKEGVARPLSKALTARGWTVWLDELELTVGDSLSGRIDAALAHSRFGVVVLSPSFFAKAWPQRELAGLAAREVEAGSKVILPVWHQVDERFIVERSPTLADRLGASTDAGLEAVADMLSLALERAGRRSSRIGLNQEALVQPVDADAGPVNAGHLGLPHTTPQQARLVAERPDFWEYLLFAGVLIQGRDELEPKWHDHELRLPGGPRRHFDRASTPDFRGSGRRCRSSRCSFSGLSGGFAW